MKKLFIPTVLLALLLPVIGSACEIKVTTENKNIKVGDIITINVEVQNQHRRCELADDDYNFDLSKNATLVDQGKWTKVSRGLFKNRFTVKVNAAGEFNFRIYRECSRKGISEDSLSFSVK